MRVPGCPCSYPMASLSVPWRTGPNIRRPTSVHQFLALHGSSRLGSYQSRIRGFAAQRGMVKMWVHCGVWMNSVLILLSPMGRYGQFRWVQPFSPSLTMAHRNICIHRTWRKGTTMATRIETTGYSLKNSSQLGLLFPIYIYIYGKIKHVPNHQPVIKVQDPKPEFRDPHIDRNESRTWFS